MPKFLEKTPYLKLNRKGILPNGPGAHIFNYNHELFVMNDTGCEIVSLIDGKLKIRQIICKLERKHKKQNKKIKTNVLEFITYLKDKNIINFHE